MGRAIQLHKLYQKIGHSIQLHTAAKETTTMFPYFLFSQLLVLLQNSGENLFCPGEQTNPAHFTMHPDKHQPQYFLLFN